MLWAQSIGMRVEKLSPYQRAQLRIKVETAVMEAELNDGILVEQHVQSALVNENGEEIAIVHLQSME